MKEIIEEIRQQIAESESNGESATDVSWKFQFGVLISREKAIKVLEVLESVSQV